MAQQLLRRARDRALAGWMLLLGLLATVRRRSARADAGMTTVEYAIGTLVAAALAAVLYRIVTGESIVTGLTNLVNRAIGII